MTWEISYSYVLRVHRSLTRVAKKIGEPVFCFLFFCTTEKWQVDYWPGAYRASATSCNWNKWQRCHLCRVTQPRLAIARLSVTVWTERPTTSMSNFSLCLLSASKKSHLTSRYGNLIFTLQGLFVIATNFKFESSLFSLPYIQISENLLVKLKVDDVCRSWRRRKRETGRSSRSMKRKRFIVQVSARRSQRWRHLPANGNQSLDLRWCFWPRVSGSFLE